MRARDRAVTDSVDPSEPVRVACWNIHHGAPRGKWFARLGTIEEGLRLLDADVVVLCEVDRRVWRSWLRHQAETLGTRLGYRVLFGPARRLSPGWYGNAVLCRTQPRRVEVVALPARPGGETRAAIVAELPFRGGSLSLAGAHLQNPGRRGAGRAEALSQLEIVFASLAGRPDPAVVIGDFNLETEDVEHRLVAQGLTPAPTGATFPFPDPDRRIDWIGVRGAEVVRSEAVPLPGSDHLAVFADLVLPLPTASS